MARKRYSDEDALKLLREIDVHLHDGLDVVSACRKAGMWSSAPGRFRRDRMRSLPSRRFEILRFTLSLKAGDKELASWSDVSALPSNRSERARDGRPGIAC